MAGVEWGPSSVPLENRRFLEVIRFSGRQLEDIKASVTSYLKEHPGAIRSEAVRALAHTPKEERRIQEGLDVLNQLSVIGKTGADVHTVIVRQAINTTIERCKGEARPRSGQGGPHYFCEIDWINPPAEKQEPMQTTPSRANYPFKTQEQQNTERQAEIVKRDADRLARIQAREKEQERRQRNWERNQERRRQLAEEKAERERITGSIIDTAKEVVEGCIENTRLKIELDEIGNAQVYYRDDKFSDYSTVNRETGTYEIRILNNPYEQRISENFMDYINFLAQQAEGKEVTYCPKKLSIEEYEDIYTKATRSGLLKIVEYPEIGKTFQFFHQGLFIDTYQTMDLENNLLLPTVFSPTQRPLNPHFSKFLKSKQTNIKE